MVVLSILGVLLIIGAIALVAQAVQGKRAGSGAIALVAFLVGLVLLLSGQMFVVVTAGQVGVVFNQISGGLRSITEGLNIIVPFIDQVTLYNGRVRDVTMSSSREESARGGEDPLEVLSSEGLVIGVDLTVLYQIDRTKTNAIHLTLGPDYANTFLRPNIRSVVRIQFAEFNAIDIIGTGRAQLQAAIEESLGKLMSDRNINLVSMNLREIRLPAQIIQAINQRQEEQQRVEQARLQVQRAEQERQVKVIQAQAEAQSIQARAEGEAQAILLRAQAEAESIRLRGEALAGNPQIIQLTVAEKLAPGVSTILVPSEGNFLLDLRSLGAAATEPGR
ncbi:MAG: prohibitin family protein [Deinococcus sp.]|nr:prohibitin family protein [Deinococcus sp.]